MSTSITPQFSDEPDDEGQPQPTNEPPTGTPEVVGEPLTLQVDKEGEPLRIINFSPDLPTESDSHEHRDLVRAGEKSDLGMPDEGWHTLARALVQPSVAASLVRNGLLIEENVEPATLSSLVSRALQPHLFPGPQPRTGAGAASVDGPVVLGDVDASGRPLPVQVLRYRSKAHLSEHLKQTVRETRLAGRRYEQSILTRGVSRPLLTQVARLEFEDGGEPLWVLIVRDGITRLVSSWVAGMDNANATPDQIADYMVDGLLTRKEPRRGGRELPESQLHARGRDEVIARRRAQFAAGLAGGTPTEAAIRIGQTFSLPVQAYVGVRPTQHSPLPADQVLNDGLRSVVSSIHVEFAGWDPAASQVEVGDRALHRVRHVGALSAGVVDLASGVLDASHTAEVFDDPAIPNEPLWRATYLVAELCQPPAFEAMKSEMRGLLGLTRIEPKRYVSYLAPIVDRPWRATKHRTLRPARRAWANGGPIPHEMLGKAWTPVPTDDFRTLVPRALAGDTAARWTLQVAGGIALVTDKLITSNVGSQFDAGVVPFRADVDDVISGLGDREAGLWILANAANAFRADQPAVNSFTDKELIDEPALAQNSYRVPAVDLENPSKLRVDKSQQPEPIREGEIVRASDPERAARAEKDREAKKAARRGAKPVKSASAQADELRREVKVNLAGVKESLDKLRTLAAAQGPHIGPMLGDWDEWQTLQMAVGEITSIVFSAQPPLHSTATPFGLISGEEHADEGQGGYGDDTGLYGEQDSDEDLGEDGDGAGEVA